MSTSRNNFLPSPATLDSSNNTLDALAEISVNEAPLSLSESFSFLCEKGIISTDMWGEYISMGLELLTQQNVMFETFDQNILSTFAQLCLRRQPGPVAVPMNNTEFGPFYVELLPHPLLPIEIFKTLRISNLIVTFLGEPESRESGKSSRKKRGCAADSNSNLIGGISTRMKNLKIWTKIWEQSYDFSTTRILINDIKVSSSWCRTRILKFSVTLTDSFNRSITLETYSNPFIIMSNRNQWIYGFQTCLSYQIFGTHSIQCSFNRFFNHVQLFYLDRKVMGADMRLLTEHEIRHWLTCVCKDNYMLQRDLNLLKQQDIVTQTLFDAWMSVAGDFFYNFHTANQYRHLKMLWSKGLLCIEGILSESSATSSSSSNKEASNSVDDSISVLKVDQGMLVILPKNSEGPDESNLALIGHNFRHVLLNLEANNLDYFFKYSKNAGNVTSLVSAINTKKEEREMSVTTLFP